LRLDLLQDMACFFFCEHLTLGKVEVRKAVMEGENANTDEMTRFTEDEKR